MKERHVFKLQEKLQSTNKVVIIPHKNPDGDAMGSTLGLHSFLKDQGYESTVITPNNYPDFLNWLPRNNEVVIFDKETTKAQKLIKEADLIFTLDFNALSRVGEMEETLRKSSAFFAMIDHHRQPDNYADFMYSDASASSTCELIYNFIEQLHQSKKITPDIATCLYTGIMTDTGSFRFPSTSGDTHRVIAALIDMGAKNALIHQKIFDTKTPDQLQLLGIALNNLKVIKELNTAYITLSQKELDDHNFKKGDTEGFVNYGLSLKGIHFAAIFIENAQEKIIKISLRSKGSFDVNTLARKHFNGGGHLNAAGGRSNQSLTQTATSFEKLLPEYKNSLVKV